MVHINSSHLAKLTNTLSYFLCFRDNYVSVKDTFWSAWSDISIHQWLVDHGYIRSDAQVKRDELIKLANEKYACLSFKSLNLIYLFIKDTTIKTPGWLLI